MMKSDEPDSTKWNCNNLSSMFGNWGFLTLLCVLPLLLPSVPFLMQSFVWHDYALTKLTAYGANFVDEK